MSILQELLTANADYVSHFGEKNAHAAPVKFPQKELVIFTCMDTRLVDFLEESLGINRGEVNIIKTAGNCILGPFDGAVRSILVSILELGAKEVIVIGHHDCGMTKTTTKSLTEAMLARGVSSDAIHMISHELDHWTHAFECPVDNVHETVAALRSNPLIPKDVPIHGMMLDPHSGKVELLVDGYEAK